MESEPPNDEPTEIAKRSINYGVSYYIAARHSVFAGLNPIFGNLAHHSIEMLLKAKLSGAYCKKHLKAHGHDLQRLWTAFKAAFPGNGLEQHDQIIEEIDGFENVRYPDSYLETGAIMAVSYDGEDFVESPSFDRPAAPKARFISSGAVPVYQFDLTDLDRLVKRIFDTCSWRLPPKLSDEALAVLERQSRINWR